MQNPHALPPGVQIDNYRIVNVIGQGGFGITYLADDLGLGVPVAVKEYFPPQLAVRQPDFSVAPRNGANADFAWGLDKFVVEAEALASLRHQNIVEIKRRIPSLNGTSYIVLHYIAGPSLKEWHRQLGRAPDQAELDYLATSLLSGLQAIHNAGLLHRDIAPKNIMLDGNPLVPMYIDFGAARQQVADRSQTLHAVLTPYYAPFEQYGGAVSHQGPWTDLYALAATFYQLISGKPPPEATERTLDDRCVPAVQIGAGLYRPEFLQAIDWALRPLPTDRPKSVSDLVNLLNPGQVTQTASVPTQSTGILTRLGLLGRK